MSSVLPSATLSSLENHIHSYRSALKSTMEITINSLTASHLKMKSVLHPNGYKAKEIDMAALIYSLNRLPSSIYKTDKIILGQNPQVFESAGFNNVHSWRQVKSTSRRRVAHFNSKSKILAYFIASISDIDDITNTLIAFQSEWNKFHYLIRQKYTLHSLFKKDLIDNKIFKIIKVSESDWRTFILSLGKNYHQKLQSIYKQPLNLKIQLLSSSWLNYTKTTQRWWKNIAKSVSPAIHLSHKNIYFVSSNTHSLLNIFTGFPLAHQFEIITYLKTKYPDLYKTWQQIKAKEIPLSPNEFLYFVSQKLLKDPNYQQEFKAIQKKLGVINIENSDYLDITAQIFPIKNLVKSKYIDSRIKITDYDKISQSDALIFNIDYPLGFSAYNIFTEVMENVSQIKGLYILGKAAALNSEIGDILIPRLVFDQHSQNSYLFQNCFNSFFPFVNNQGSILTNQKAVSVIGTFLENKALLNYFLKNNLTVIEMESGPYLTAVTESSYDQQAPKNTIVDLNNVPFDLGIINYASDTPYSTLQNLGTSQMGINGIEAVTLGSLAILQRIINLEEKI